MTAILIPNLSIIFLGFLMNLAWEVGHSLLYAWDPPISSYIPHILFISVKDTLVILALYWLLALVYKKSDWIFDINKSDYLFAMFLGLMYALAIEIHATQTGRWQYNELMPLIPILNIGITPLLQMAILPPLTFYLTYKKFWPPQLT